MSNFFFPGANDVANGTTTHFTWLRAKPICRATAYATADSYPLPVVGSLNFHGLLCSPPPNHGGKAGLSVPMVSVPDWTSGRLAVSQTAAWDWPPAAPAAPAMASDGMSATAPIAAARLTKVTPFTLMRTRASLPSARPGLRLDGHVARLVRDAGEPGTDGRVPGEVDAGLVRHVRVRVERDVGDGVRGADEELPRGEVPLHAVERGERSLRLLGDAVGEAIRVAEDRDPEAQDRDVRLVAVLLEEHPLQGLGALEGVPRHVRGAVAQVPDDRVGLRQRPPVVEVEHRHPQRRVALAEHRLAARAVDHVHLAALVVDAEVREQKADLVAVAGVVRVVEEHVALPVTGPAILGGGCR